MTEETRTSQYTAPPERLDKVLCDLWPDISRARWQTLIKSAHIALDGSVITSPKHKVSSGTQVSASIPAPAPARPQPEDIALDILHEDTDVVVVNKPAGLVVHPAAGNATGTLVNALLHHCQGSLSGIGGELRPGIVHRLDKDTSGIMVVAKNDMAHQHLSSQFADHSIHRRYKALVWGKIMPPAGTITGAIGRHPQHRQKMAVVESGGKHATTHYTTERTFLSRTLPPASLVTCQLETGRTHQIRVHMTKIGHPLMGDPVYSSRKYMGISLDITSGHTLAIFDRQALHAGELGFTHPRSGKHTHFRQEMPSDFIGLIEFLEKNQ